MIQTIPKLVTFDEFVAWYPENSPHREVQWLTDGLTGKVSNPQEAIALSSL